MADNVNIIVQDTINDIVVNSAVTVETIDINVQVAVDEVTIIANPNEYVINVNRIIGEQVQSDWNETDDQAPDYIKNKPIIPAAQVNSDWDATSGVAEILNKPTIPAAVTKTSDLINDGEDGVNPFITLEDIPPVTGFVPYMGATQDVDLGLFDITAAHLIKDGGVSTQFLKADGSVDNNVYLTSADLPSTLDLYATTTASDVSGYTVLVRNISDSRFNTTAVDVSTGVITTTAQLVGSLVSDANIISGNPGIFNITTIGNISRTSGTGQAEFFFRVYKRDNLGVETFITESSKTLPVTNGGYVEFSAVALWNDGIFTDTDRVVLKYYADRLTSPVGSNPVYKFQFGGISPVRSTAAIPVAVLPNIYLRDLADVENVDALNNEVLYWNDADSLWEHSLVIDLLSPASSTVNGYLTSTDWTAFNGKFNLPSLTSGSVLFSNGTTIAQKNSNFFWDNTNNRLGIGTNVPTLPLDVNGAARIIGTLNIGNTGTVGNISLKRTSDGAEVGGIRADGAGTQIGGSGYSSNILLNNGSTGTSGILFTTGGERMRLFGATGNLVINSTTDNGGKLQIKAPGALSTDIALRVRNSADTGDLMTVNGLGVNTVGRLVTNGTLISTSITDYLNTIGGTQTVYASLAAFSSTAHTYFSPTITSNLATARPVAVAIVPTTSGTLNSKTVLYLSNSNLAPSTGGVNGTININENTTSGYGILIGMGNGSSSVGLYINAAKKAIDIAGPVSGGNGIAINRSSSTLVQYNPITTYEAFAGILSPSILEYRNTTTGNSTEITALDIINSSANSAGVLGNNAGINLRFGMNTSLGVTNYAKIAAICPNQTTSPSVIDLGFYVSNSSGTSTNALYISGQTQSIGVGTIVPVASAKVQIDSTTQGFLPPRMTNAQRLAIATPAVGLMVYCTDTVEGVYVNKSTGWTFIG